MSIFEQVLLARRRRFKLNNIPSAFAWQKGAIMDFTIPDALSKDLSGFKQFLNDRVQSRLPEWYQRREIPADFFREMGAGQWYGITSKSDKLIKGSALREALIAEELAKISPGLAVAALVHIDLGLIALHLCGSDGLKSRYGPSAAKGQTLMHPRHPEHHCASMRATTPPTIILSRASTVNALAAAAWA